MFSAVAKPPVEAAGLEGRRSVVAAERRRTTRVPLRCTVYLSRNGAALPLHSVTRDISCDGFYCFVNQRFGAGDHVECDIVVPTHQSRDPDDVFYLRCRAQAVRVEIDGAGKGYGLACRIENYRLIHGPVSRISPAGSSESGGRDSENC